MGQTCSLGNALVPASSSYILGVSNELCLVPVDDATVTAEKAGLTCACSFSRKTVISFCMVCQERCERKGMRATLAASSSLFNLSDMVVDGIVVVGFQVHSPADIIYKVLEWDICVFFPVPRNSTDRTYVCPRL